MQASGAVDIINHYGWLLGLHCGSTKKRGPREQGRRAALLHVTRGIGKHDEPSCSAPHGPRVPGPSRVAPALASGAGRRD